MFKLNEQPEAIVRKLDTREKKVTFMQGVLADPLRFFCPNGAQERFINTVANSARDTNIPVILATYANGVGKSTVAIHTLLNFIYGPQNGWFDYPIFSNFPYPKKIWYCSTADAIKGVIWPKIESLLALRGGYVASKDGKSIVSTVKFPEQGWEMSFKTFDQDAKTYESADIGILVADEPEPEDKWKAGKSRRRMGCITMLPMTPLDCEPYILDEVKKHTDEGDKGYFHLEADVYEACQERGTRGHLPADVIDDMVKDYDEDERMARAYGKFMYFSRRIFRNLDRDKHFVDPEEYPIPLHSVIIHVVDPHDSRPSASVWMAKTPTGRFIVFDEYPIDQNTPFWDMKTGLTTDEEVEAWAEIETKQKGMYSPNSKKKRILDRHFGWQTRGGKTFAQAYLDAGIRIQKNFTFMSSYKAPGNEAEVTFGHKEIRRLLKPMADGKPGLVIWNNCYHTWNGLTHYIRRKIIGKAADSKAAADGQIVEKYKDFPDVIRYGVCSDFVARLPKAEETKDSKLWKTVRTKKVKTFGNMAENI